MGSVHQLSVKKKVYEYDNCSGCNVVIPEDDDLLNGYMEIVLPYEEYDKHIVLCPKCYKSAERHKAF